MFDALKNLMDSMAPRFAGPSTPAAPSVHLAAAVLLMEVMRAESTVSVEERAAAARDLRTQFGFQEAEIAPLLDGAERETQVAYDYFRFTSVLNEQLSQPQKIALVEAMWRAAYADLHLDPAENAVISQVAELLHVTHGEYIAAKLRAQLPV
ncbi:TerB family tellurite resistance protein [Ramlibacter sp.]|uniref:tellurite resistance TerB family protein n=1 Tax=Ramlibacter sp. TaxID=1917967 RepID=UPI00179DA275|nr:TerB family tellurite resistance protein [Ramlibacter sp.]MBA2676396.1 TerB family tellurite resistance protein [Ramlibacter sp.]